MKIKSCPFCGGSGRLLPFSDGKQTLGYFVECENLLEQCRVAPCTDICEMKNEAIMIWNERC